ncbi:hypothetical protein C1708_33530 [Streptomyces sp. DH-12]|nr:hypothetical protein C1708_33530 [Streptomyces sp. DH-12]
MIRWPSGGVSLEQYQPLIECIVSTLDALDQRERMLKGLLSAAYGLDEYGTLWGVHADGWADFGASGELDGWPPVVGETGSIEELIELTYQLAFAFWSSQPAQPIGSEHGAADVGGQGCGLFDRAAANDAAVDFMQLEGAKGFRPCRSCASGAPHIHADVG